MNLLGLLAMAALLSPAPRTILDGVHVVDVAAGEILRDRRW
jgi:hypothetical protein